MPASRQAPESVRIESGRFQTHVAASRVSAGRAAMALWLGLIALTLVRAAGAVTHSMWGWGFDLMRFVPSGVGWTLWGIAALPLLPWAGRRLSRVMEAVGKRFDRSQPIVYTLSAALAAALVWAFPDRLRFVGDFLLRFGTAERALKPSALFPQALPLDVLLHYGIPRLFDGAVHMDVNTTARLLGSLEAAALACLAIAFARALGQRGSFAVATAAIVFWGGYLGLFTGYGKAIAEVTLLTVAVAVFGLRVIREGRGLVELSLCVAAGFLLHRSTLGLIPALLVSWAFALRAQGSPVRRNAPATWVAAGVPIVALAIMLPRMLGTFATMDSVHFTPPEVVRQGGVLSAMFAGARPADLVSVVGLLSPLALALPFGLLALGRWGAHAREGTLLAALALPWLAMLLLIHPPQGMFRDWDDFCAAAITLSMMTAWLLSLAARTARGWSWLCVPAALAAIAPSVLWLVHNADLRRGLARVETYLGEPPPRSEEERAKTWDFLGIRYAQLDLWDRSAHAMEKAAELAPSPRVLLQWALAEQTRGNDLGAQAVYQRLVELTPDDWRAWYGLAFVSWRATDPIECRRAANAMLRLRPGDPQAQAILEQLDRADSVQVAPAPR